MTKPAEPNPHHKEDFRALLHAAASTPPLEQRMKAYALEQLALRKKNQPEHVKNETLYAGSNMFFYCRLCGWLADLLPEGFISKPRKLCSECQLLKDKGWV